MWVHDKIPSNIKATHVYAVVFSDDGRILLMLDEESFKLPNCPLENVSYEETIKKMFLDVLNIEIDNIEYLGYLKVEDNYEVTIIGKIKNVYENNTDKDKLYTRVLVGQSKVKSMLKLDDVANQMIDDSINLANQKYMFININEKGQVI